jgi:hypothetical protein
MPREFLMSWEGAPNYRWVKMYKGVRYRVTCQELRCTVFTKHGSGHHADQWWRQKRAELEGPPRPDIHQVMYEQHREDVRQSPPMTQFVDRLAPHLPRVAENADRSVRANSEAFLQVVRGDMRALSSREVRQYVQSLGL